MTYNDQPLTSGEVVYSPIVEDESAAEDGSTGSQARGIIQKDGTFVMSTSPSVPGVIPGKYAISIVAYEGVGQTPSSPSENQDFRSFDERRTELKGTVPERYLDAKTSGLEEVVDENHSGSIDIKLID